MILPTLINTADTANFSLLWRTATTVAVIGLSPKPERPSYRVAHYLLDQGFRVIPVNPGQAEILGQTCYPSLTAAYAATGWPIDIVDIFRKSKDVPPIVAEAVGIGAKTIWMQEGVVNEEAAALAESHGLTVVMDRCLMVEHRRGAQGLT
ncbi:MAG TPA: CoA-binding protein [Desulfobulbaceae bacterium]|nr:CoA-binding protein [Desulfobulbaceae bacterium]